MATYGKFWWLMVAFGNFWQHTTMHQCYKFLHIAHSGTLPFSILDDFLEKFQKEGGGHFRSKNLSTPRKKRTTVFGNKGGAGEGVTGRLEVFRKFIQNGTVKRPLIPLHTRTNKQTCESTTKVCWGSHCKIHFWGLGSNSIQEISFFRVTRKKSVGARLQLSGIQTLIFWEPRFIYVAVQSWDLKIHSSGSQDFIFWDANFLGIQTFVVYDPNFKIHVIHPTIQL